MTFIKRAAVNQFVASANTEPENWYIQKAKLKKRYPILTDDDLLYDKAKNGTIWEALKTKFDLNKEELQKIISPG